MGLAYKLRGFDRKDLKKNMCTYFNKQKRIDSVVYVGNKLYPKSEEALKQFEILSTKQIFYIIEDYGDVTIYAETDVSKIGRQVPDDQV